MVVQRMDHLNRVHAAGDIKHGAVAEVCAELLAIQRRRCNDQPQGLRTASSPASAWCSSAFCPRYPELEALCRRQIAATWYEGHKQEMHAALQHVTHQASCQYRYGP